MKKTSMNEDVIYVYLKIWLDFPAFRTHVSLRKEGHFLN